MSRRIRWKQMSRNSQHTIDPYYRSHDSKKETQVTQGVEAPRLRMVPKNAKTTAFW